MEISFGAETKHIFAQRSGPTSLYTKATLDMRESNAPANFGALVRLYEGWGN